MGCNGNCGTCGGCGGSCSGCAGELMMTAEALDFLRQLGQIPFLPVARKMDDPTPVYLEEGMQRQARMTLILQLLEKKGLISLDFHRPLKHFDDPAYAAYPIRGSIALTERGYKVLELLEYQGYSEE